MANLDGMQMWVLGSNAASGTYQAHHVCLSRGARTDCGCCPCISLYLSVFTKHGVVFVLPALHPLAHVHPLAQVQAARRLARACTDVAESTHTHAPCKGFGTGGQAAKSNGAAAAGRWPGNMSSGGATSSALPALLPLDLLCLSPDLPVSPD